MIYKDLNINLADMNVKIKFREETEISFQTMDIDSLKEIASQTKKIFRILKSKVNFHLKFLDLSHLQITFTITARKKILK